MTITAEGIITAAAVIAAVIGILKYLSKIYDLVKHQKKQDEDIADIKKEQTLVITALIACLDGLQQLGANHSVPEAKQKLSSYLIEEAHKTREE